MELRYRQPVLNGEHAGGMAQDPLSLGERACEHPGVVRQENTGKTERAGHVEEVRDLVGGRAVHGAGHHIRIVGDDGHALPAQTGQSGHDRSPERRLDGEERPVVHQ